MIQLIPNRIYYTRNGHGDYGTIVRVDDISGEYANTSWWGYPTVKDFNNKSNLQIVRSMSKIDAITWEIMPDCYTLEDFKRC